MNSENSNEIFLLSGHCFQPISKIVHFGRILFKTKYSLPAKQIANGILIKMFDSFYVVKISTRILLPVSISQWYILSINMRKVSKISIRLQLIFVSFSNHLTILSLLTFVSRNVSKPFITTTSKKLSFESYFLSFQSKKTQNR